MTFYLHNYKFQKCILRLRVSCLISVNILLKKKKKKLVNCKVIWSIHTSYNLWYSRNFPIKNVANFKHSRRQLFVYVQVSGTCLVCKTVLKNDCIILLRQKAFVALCKITIKFSRFYFYKTKQYKLIIIAIIQYIFLNINSHITSSTDFINI